MKTDRETGNRARARAALALIILAAYSHVIAAEPFSARVVIVGDSIMRAVSHSLKRELSTHPGFKVNSFTYLRPGLSRLDLFDWLGVIERISKENKPDFAVVMFGASDRQAIHIKTSLAGAADSGDGGEAAPLPLLRIINKDDPEWIREYSRRVGAAMDIMIDAGVRRIFWIELPDMRDSELQAESLMINMLIQKEAEARPKVTFLSSKKLLSRTPGVYSSYIYGTNGMPIEVRSAEGVNMNDKGADILAREIVSRILDTRSNNAP